MLRILPPLLVLLLLAAPGAAQQPCPEISGDYTLTGDLVCDRLYLPSDTTLDLNGFTLRARITPGTPASLGAGNVTVTNGTIADSTLDLEFCGGCLLEDVHLRSSGGTLGDHNTIRRSRLTSSGFDFYYGDNITIEDSHLEESGIGGYNSDGNVIQSNVFDNSSIFISNAEDFHGGSFYQIEGNLFVSSDFSPIVMSIGDCFYHPQSGPRDTCVEGNVVANNLFVGNQREASW